MILAKFFLLGVVTFVSLAIVLAVVDTIIHLRQ